MVYNVLKFVHICRAKKYTILASQHLTIFYAYMHTVLKCIFFLCMYINLTLNMLEINHVNNFSVLSHILKNWKENICLRLTLFHLVQVHLFLNQQALFVSNYIKFTI